MSPKTRGCILRGVRLGLLAFSGLLPLLLLLEDQPDPTLLIYSGFTLLVLASPLLRRVVCAIPLPSALLFGGLIVGAGWALELLAWLNNVLRCHPDPPLLHPQLFPDLIAAVGFYGSWGVAWALLLRRYHFTLPQIFFTQGAYGILIEQQGAIFLQGLVTMPLGLLIWLYALLVYGAIIGSAYCLVGPRFEQRSELRDHWRKYPIALVSILLTTLVVSGVWFLLTFLFLPEPGPICERPFW
jgi:hypothetical protein